MKKPLRASLVLFFVVTSLVLFASSAFAAIYTINTDDATVEEWANQGIQVFKTDPDMEVDRPDEDIINTWIATTSDDRLGFLVQVAGSPALDGDQYRAIVASLDCDADGVEFETEPDRLVFYFWESDKVGWAKGDQSFGEVMDGSEPDGQRVNDFLEWKIRFNRIAGCLSVVNVKFYTAVSATAINLDSWIDDSGDLKAYNVPTSLTLTSLNVQSQHSIWRTIIPFVFYLLIILCLLFFVGISFRKYQISKNLPGTK
jgi:hypothetical protein